jgi:iron complex outermembrane receptor protein
MKNSIAAVAALSMALPGALAYASSDTQAPANGGREEQNLEEIVVFGKYLSQNAAHIDVVSEPVLDAAESLSRLPGADANVNGRISGIAQYRGMYGDRVAVTVDGIGMISGGPNAMDAPLSYVSPMITEELVLERGIPGVTSAPESVGGYIDARLARGAFGVDDRFAMGGMVGMRYSGNGDTRSVAGRLTFANREQRLSVLAEADRSDGISTPLGDIVPSQVMRDRYDVSYSLATGHTNALLYVGALDTRDTGTPALAMDIRKIDTSIVGAEINHWLDSGLRLKGRIGYNDVTHSMDNFTLRAAPAAVAFRQNDTSGKGGVFELSGMLEFGNGSLTVGVDGRRAQHESLITNPNNPMFFVQNFNDLERNLTGVFAVANFDSGQAEWELGIRYNDVRMDTGLVASAGMMAMMGNAATELATAFNSADRSRDFGNLDAVLKYRRALSADLTLLVDVGSKSRAPSYQEMYLWLPLAATGGLADGRSYIGNLELQPERNNEMVLGLRWANDRFELAPRIFYRNVDDYIQGVPASNMTANMLAQMMSGQPALQFSNVDARIFGADLGWRYNVSERLSFDGNAAYARGERRDSTDNLYRLAPPNASVGINYLDGPHSLRMEIVGFTKQDHVSAYNQETATAGYAIANVLWAWQPRDVVQIELQARNLFDRGYQNHLAGVNRVGASDIPVGERLYGMQRSFTLGARFSF